MAVHVNEAGIGSVGAIPVDSAGFPVVQAPAPVPGAAPITHEPAAVDAAGQPIPEAEVPAPATPGKPTPAVPAAPVNEAGKPYVQLRRFNPVDSAGWPL
jgi:hypothetical protein